METEIEIYKGLYEIYIKKLKEKESEELAAFDVVNTIQDNLISYLEKQKKELTEKLKNANKKKET